MATVKNPLYKNSFVIEGNTEDIMKVVLEMAKESKKTEVQSWVRENFEPTYGGLRKLWHWCKNNIKYVEDPSGKQLIKSAARTFHERDKGTDCKSFTIFIIKCLEALNIKYTIRFISQGTSSIPSHVYPIAHLGRKNVIMDAVYNQFDKMPKHYKKYDFSMTKIYKLSGIQDANDVKAQRALVHFEQVTAFIPDSILDEDITKMSEGEFLRYVARPLMAKASPSKRSAFLSKTARMTKPAFNTPTVVASEAEGVAGIRDAIKKIGNKIKETWRKLVNWVFKETVEKAAIYFLYLFSDVNAPTINKKRAVQQKIFNAIADFSNCDPKILMGAIEAKLTKKFGMHPTQYLNGSAIKGVEIGYYDDINGIGCADGVTTAACIAGAVATLIPLVNKILDYLNKNVAEEGGEKTKLKDLISKIKEHKPDLEEFIKEAKATFSNSGGAKSDIPSKEDDTPNTPPPSTPPKSNASDVFEYAFYAAGAYFLIEAFAKKK